MVERIRDERMGGLGDRHPIVFGKIASGRCHRRIGVHCVDSDANTSCLVPTEHALESLAHPDESFRRRWSSSRLGRRPSAIWAYH